MNELIMTPIEEVIDDIRRGKAVVVVDDANRENEGDLTIAAENVSAEDLAFMMTEGRGLICLSLHETMVETLGLSMQVSDNKSPFGTNFTVSIDHKSVLGRGVSAGSRALTIREAVREGARAENFVSPGFVFPLRAVPGGVLRRRGQTEAAVDLARLAGLRPAGVICEIMGADGEMLRGEALQQYCSNHGLSLTSVEEIVQYRLHREVVMREVARCSVSVEDALGEGFFAGFEQGLSGAAPGIEVRVYEDDLDGSEHLAFIAGNPEDGACVRVHSECLTGDIFGSRRCDCGWQFREALERIVTEGEGVLIYLFQEGRGIGLGNKIRAYALQEQGFDTVDANLKLGFAADMRSFRGAAQILQALGLSRIKLLSNNPEKVTSLEDYGIQVIERLEHVGGVHKDNLNYLETKRDRMGHIISSLVAVEKERE